MFWEGSGILLGTHYCLHISRRVEHSFFPKQGGEDVVVTVLGTLQIPGNRLVEVRLVFSCSRKPVIFLATVKEMPRTDWVTEMELNAKVLHLDQSRGVEICSSAAGNLLLQWNKMTDARSYCWHKAGHFPGNVLSLEHTSVSKDLMTAV